MLEQEFNSHPIWRQFDSLTEHMADYGEPLSSSDAYISTKQRLRYLRFLLKKSDRMLMTMADLDYLQNQSISPMLSSFQSYPKSLDALNQAESYYASFVRYIGSPRHNRFVKSDAVDVISDFRTHAASIQGEMTEFFQSLNASVLEIEQQKNKVEAKLSELGSEADRITGAFSAKSTTWDSDVKAAIEKAKVDFQSQIENARLSLEHIVERAKESEKSRVNDNSRLLVDERKKFRENIESMIKEFDSDCLSLKAGAQDIKEKISNLYLVAGQNATAGDFEKNAAAEVRLASMWGIAAAICYISVPLIFGWAIWKNGGITLDLGVVASKVLMALPFAIPAWYFGSLSARHRRTAISFRALGVRAGTLDAYLANIEEPKRSDIKIELARRLFTEPLTGDKSGGLSRGERKELVEMTGALSNAVEKAVGVIRGGTP